MPARDAYLEQHLDIQYSLYRVMMSTGHCDIDQALSQWSAEQQVAPTRWVDVVAQFKPVHAPDFAVYAVVLRELSELASVAQVQ